MYETFDYSNSGCPTVKSNKIGARPPGNVKEEGIAAREHDGKGDVRNAKDPKTISDVAKHLFTAI